MYLYNYLKERGLNVEDSNSKPNYAYDKNDCFKSINKYIKYQLLDNLIKNKDQ